MVAMIEVDKRRDSQGAFHDPPNGELEDDCDTMLFPLLVGMFLSNWKCAWNLSATLPSQ